MQKKISSNSDYSSNKSDPISEVKKFEENLSKPENAARKPKRKTDLDLGKNFQLTAIIRV